MQDWIDKLERAKALLDAGALTPEEYEAEKARLLPAPLSNFADRGEHFVSEPLDKSEPLVHDGSIKAAIVAAIAIGIAVLGYLLFAGKSPELTRKSPVTTTTQPPKIPQTATPTPAAAKAANRTVMPPSVSPMTATPASTEQKASSWTATEQALIARWKELNELCRGGSGDDPKTMEACDLRDAASTQLDSADICYGEEGQYDSQMEMHRCNPRSMARQQSPQ